MIERAGFRMASYRNLTFGKESSLFVLTVALRVTAVFSLDTFVDINVPGTVAIHSGFKPLNTK